MGLKQLGHVVAVTGARPGDGPALGKADVGFSMGVTGTEIAKQFSDIVLLDDDFASMVDALKWGRSLVYSARKCFQFQISALGCIIGITIVGVLLLKEPPFSGVQLISIHLLAFIMALFALVADDPPE